MDYVIDHYFSWNSDQDTGQVILKFSNGKQAQYKVTSLSDMAAWAALVGQKPLFISDDGTTLHTYPLNAG